MREKRGVDEGDDFVVRGVFEGEGNEGKESEERNGVIRPTAVRSANKCRPFSWTEAME